MKRSTAASSESTAPAAKRPTVPAPPNGVLPPPFRPNASSDGSQVPAVLPQSDLVVATEGASGVSDASDDFDMFSDPLPETLTPKESILTTSTLSDNWDDEGGFYILRLGELFNEHYRITGNMGKGVFSTVYQCEDIAAQGHRVAIKIIRSNEKMTRDSRNEIKILRHIAEKDPKNKSHCIHLLDDFFYRKHMCFVFPSLSMNLRETITKYGRDIGLSLASVRSFGKQLFCALAFLSTLNIVHADLKPDNILMSEGGNSILLCDFGSAFYANDLPEITPLLVSRFYRAPEIILGLPYTQAIDVWSAGCVLFELFTGKFMFDGRTNNEMILQMLELPGSQIPSKMIDNHIKSYSELIRETPYFDEGFFLYFATDTVTGKPTTIRKRLPDIPKRDLQKEIRSRATDIKGADNLCRLLLRCFTVNPKSRITAKEALSDPFFKAD